MDTSGFVHLKVSLEDEGRLVVLLLDHGKANEMGKEQLTELETLVDRLSGQTRAVALITHSAKRSGKGTPIFVAGANVTERAGWKPEQVREHVRWQRRVLARLRRAPVFHVAVVDGIALGWGTEFMLTADFRIAGDSATFGLPETSLGIIPGAGGASELWSHISVPQTLRLGMTGERIGADEALSIGLVQERAKDTEAGLVRARALAAMVAKRSPTAVAAFKHAVLSSVGQPSELREESEARAYEHCLTSGEAAIGRANFTAILEGKPAPWGPRVLIER